MFSSSWITNLGRKGVLIACFSLESIDTPPITDLTFSFSSLVFSFAAAGSEQYIQAGGESECVLPLNATWSTVIGSHRPWVESSNSTCLMGDMSQEVRQYEERSNYQS